MSEAEGAAAPPAAAPPAAAASASDGMIPRARLNEVLAERDTLRGQMEELQKQLANLEPAQTRAEELAQQLTQVKALSRAGIVDDDGQAVAGMLYDRLATKPEGGIGAWLEGFSAEGASVPRPLQPYLHKPAPPAPAAAAPAPAPASPPAAARPDPNSTAVAPGDGRLSPEALTDAHARAMRGDRSAHDAIRRHMKASGWVQ